MKKDYENLKLRACTVWDYLIKCKTIAMFASIRDIRDKEAWQLTKLRAMGIKGRTHLFANTSSNFYLLTAYLPKERKAAASELQYVSDTVSEEEIAAYRRELKELG